MKTLFLFISFFLCSANAQTLHSKQAQFSQLAAQLILHANELGYEVTLGEAWRSAVVADYQMKWYADHGLGILHSLHLQRLAIDLELFKNGKYLTKTEDYLPLGTWWERQCADCSWGGKFKNLPDGNHFSIENGGIR